MSSLKSASRDRGAVLVETALLVPLLVMLAVGLAEYGMTWSSANGVADALGTASLQAARSPNSRVADERVLQTMAGSVDDLDEVQWVIVYRTSTADGAPPASCRALAAGLTSGSSGVAGLCNVFHGSVLADLDRRSFRDPACSGELDALFCPATRVVTLTSGQRIGVAASVRHRWMMGLLPGGGTTWEDRSVAVPLLP